MKFGFNLNVGESRWAAVILKDKFDIMPVYGDIVEYDYIKVRDNLGREYNKKILESKRIYKALEYLEITKDKQLIDIDLSLRRWKVWLN